MFQRILFCQQTQFFTQFLPCKAAKVHKQPSKSTGGSKRQSDSPNNQGVNIPIAGHNALASLKKESWKLCINSVWCHMMSQISWSHHFRPLGKKLSCLEPFSHCHSFALFFPLNQAEQESQARSSGSFSEFRSGSPNRKSLGRQKIRWVDGWSHWPLQKHPWNTKGWNCWKIHLVLEKGEIIDPNHEFFEFEVLNFLPPPYSGCQ